MNELKLSLTIILPGRTLRSEKECMRKVRKPLMGKGKKANEQVIDKNGKEVWVTVKEFDPAKSERFIVNLKGKDNTEIPPTVYTRGAKPATKTININSQAYDYFIGREVPATFHAPKNCKPNFKIRKSINEQAWLQMSQEQRLEWHLREICTSMNGVLSHYDIFED